MPTLSKARQVAGFNVDSGDGGFWPDVSSDAQVRRMPKGTGTVSFGTWTSNADAAVNGYVTITDSSGNTRKLATIA